MLKRSSPKSPKVFIVETSYYTEEKASVFLNHVVLPSVAEHNSVMFHKLLECMELGEGGTKGTKELATMIRSKLHSG